jgi:hypothetical protein
MANSWQYDETSRRPLQQRAQIPESDSDSRFLFTRAPAAVAAAGNGNLMRASQGSSALVERGLRGLAAVGTLPKLSTNGVQLAHCVCFYRTHPRDPGKLSLGRPAFLPSRCRTLFF